MFRPSVAILGVFALTAVTAAAAGLPPTQIQNSVIVSVKDQKLMLLQNGQRVAIYPISTSKFGLGDYWGHMTTPLGYLQVAQKIGDHAPSGAVFRNRRFTGEVLKPNAPGRDPVITRIIWLRGLEQKNAHAFARCIYIHGTPEEKTIGRPASYGCIRMRSRDVTALYNELPLGAVVQIVESKLPNVQKAKAPQMMVAKPEEKPADWVNSASKRRPISTSRKTLVAARNSPRA
ncbi:MAG TPA: L,D-transpeptidase [Chthoniobacterales bacterium]|nr:L,D-transpeptidase [Chthoniobacterales bacterium]